MDVYDSTLLPCTRLVKIAVLPDSQIPARMTLRRPDFLDFQSTRTNNVMIPTTMAIRTANVVGSWEARGHGVISN